MSKYKNGCEPVALHKLARIDFKILIEMTFFCETVIHVLPKNDH